MKMTGIIFSNIYDNTLGELTKKRTVASVPFGGRYRQIDFVLSNMVNSNITKVGVITKYHYQSLMDHLGSAGAWDLDRKNGGLYIIPPFANMSTEIYRGKLEALYGALSFLKKAGSDYVVLCDSVVICNIDFEKVLESHIKSGADVTCVANKEAENMKEESKLLLKIDDNGFAKDITINCIPEDDDYAGMGMFIMEREKLVEVVEKSVAHGFYHFEKDYLQYEFNQGNLSVNVYKFNDVVLKNSSVASYFKNNFKLLDYDVRKSIFNPRAPIYTKVRDEAPTYYGEGSKADDCLIADGCKIMGEAENSVIFRDVVIEKGAKVKNAIIMQGSKIGKDSVIENVIIDKDVEVGMGRTLIGASISPLIISKGEKI
ncbi:MAG: glucose-1-phosphate adenylyltransferase subunit GlgD [Ruminococcaceae bacterium]|nr:glucose-1-phosphate adenylyltransferase subunit GlgD [Oscillospiraceae bacterium]